MADGQPPKPAEDIKLAAPQPAAQASAPEPKVILPAFNKPAALPDVAAEAASALKKPEAKIETKPAEQTEEKKAPEKKRSLKIRLFEKGVDAAGFGEILKAWRSPQNRFRNVMKSIGGKAADMVAGRLVSMTFKMIAVTWVAGIIGGVSTFGGLALLALATGAASSIYTYGKDYLYDRFYGPKDKRKDAKLNDPQRFRSAGIAFATGTLNGALGAWLAKTGILQNLFGWAKDFVLSGGGLLSQKFNASAANAVAAPLNTPNVWAAFSIAAAPAVAPAVPEPVVELAYAPQAIPRAVPAVPGFRSC